MNGCRRCAMKNDDKAPIGTKCCWQNDPDDNPYEYRLDKITPRN